MKTNKKKFQQIQRIFSWSIISMVCLLSCLKMRVLFALGFNNRTCKKSNSRLLFQIVFGVSLDTLNCEVTRNICQASIDLFFRDAETAVYA